MSAANVRAAVLMLRAALDVLDPPAPKTRTPRPSPASPAALADHPASPEDDATAVLDALRSGAEPNGAYRRGIRALETSVPGLPRWRVRQAIATLEARGAVRETPGPRGRMDLALLPVVVDVDDEPDDESIAERA